MLIGGSANSIALQPLSVQGQVGLNVAAGLESLARRAGIASEAANRFRRAFGRFAKQSIFPEDRIAASLR